MHFQPLNLTSETTDQLADAEQHDLERRERLYRMGRPFPTLADQIVILVDDGLETGSTMRAAVGALTTEDQSCG